MFLFSLVKTKPKKTETLSLSLIKEVVQSSRNQLGWVTPEVTPVEMEALATNLLVTKLLSEKQEFRRGHL